MLYYKILNTDKHGFVSLRDFRFYHPGRQRMYMTMDLQKAQYVIFQGQYYKVAWLAEAPELIGKYPELIIDLVSEEEYMAEMAKVESEQK